MMFGSGESKVACKKNDLECWFFVEEEKLRETRTAAEDDKPARVAKPRETNTGSNGNLLGRLQSGGLQRMLG